MSSNRRSKLNTIQNNGLRAIFKKKREFSNEPLRLLAKELKLIDRMLPIEMFRIQQPNNHQVNQWIQCLRKWPHNTNKKPALRNTIKLKLKRTSLAAIIVTNPIRHNSTRTITIWSCHYWQPNHRNGLLFKFQSRSLIKQIVFRSIRSQAQKV